MLFPVLDLNYIGQRFDAIAPAVVSAGKQAGVEDPDHSPSALQQAMHRLMELLEILSGQVDSARENPPPSLNELSELGDYGIQLLVDFSTVAAGLKMPQESEEMEDLTLPMALWLVRHNGELRTLEPVINSLARLANRFREPSQLRQLYELSMELIKALEPTMQQEPVRLEKAQPWSILLMNQAIIATRSYQPELIEEAYQTLCRLLPDQAPNFFREGMEQMDALNYPQQVREVVEKYYNLWGQPRTLH
ncbi:MAG: hypothetical protein JAY75_16930 [Candidatus Thiodiazotropha taylori]|nr:hypothetical protein [Candidatus Thiodiazotropha sp. (ex Lucina pensylvanica)]MBT3053157.1 hypothetical protein [Candidatus Thiodiazotropha sp. (ex Codakia orbicularis)]MBV2127117.1 hypothetical protein [Candidatus Thiodiazotropha taylori]MCW4225477.1 hypothetical protein [Candidatus Thiodiazotropha endolucinida]MCG7876129.1 hypothetical protein [Candidatus Thiodiazotropha taylori]